RDAAKFDPMERFDTREKLFYTAPRSAVTAALGQFLAAAGEIQDPSQKSELQAALGFVHYQQGDLQKARDRIAAPLKGARTNTLALLYEGQMFLDANNLPKAEKTADELLQLDRNSACAHLLMARILNKRGKTLEAQSEYEAALRFNPELFLAMFEKD